MTSLTAFTACCCAVTVVLLLAGPVFAEQLPLRHYSVADGLPHSTVRRIFQDSRGYLWIGTADGLARFDGYRFNTYDTSDGLGHTFINSIAEDREGRIWVATNGGGVSCLEDGASSGQKETATSDKAGRRRFVSFLLANEEAANRVNALLFDGADRLWCATDGGLFRADLPSGRIDSLTFDLIVPHRPVACSMGALLDTRGRMWFGVAETIVEVAGDQIVMYECGDSLKVGVNSIVEDHQGRLIASSDNGILAFVEPPPGQSKGAWQPIPMDLSGCRHIQCLMVDYEGSFWIGGQRGLVKFKGDKRSSYGQANGLTDSYVECVEQDRDRNIWIGSNSGGLFKLSGTAAIGFARSDGIPASPVERIFVDTPGHIIAGSRDDGFIEISDGRITPLEWSKKAPFASAGGRICRDLHGTWWIGTGAGLFSLFSPDFSSGQTRRLNKADGGPDGNATDIYCDPSGKLWFGTSDHLLHGLDIGGPAKHGHPRPLTTGQLQGPAIRLTSDRNGVVWAASPVTLARIVDGQSINQPPTDGLPETAVRAFFLDSRGWMWLGLRNKGVSICKNPAARTLEFVNYSMADGLASNTVWSITEDDWGRIYLGTGKGLDRFDPADGRIRHITAGENLAGDLFVDCINDGAGHIWLATTTTIVELDPRAEPAQTRPPPIYLSRLTVEGTEVPIADEDTHSVPSLVLGPSGNDLFIEYVGLDFHSEHELKYQYKLEGVDSDWSASSTQRSVNYARLSPGSYTFAVRALNQQGLVSPEPAILRIRILPPIWRRWWFIMMAVTGVMLVAYAAHRYRIARLMELLAVRSRIASDLHDDIGANLTKIAILSEVANRQLDPAGEPAESPINAIARISRESVASMSDIVWAIDPRRDTHLDLTRRMRQFAIDLLGSSGIDVRVESTDDDQPGRVGPDFRRQVFLVFKEAVHNAARHSHCSKVEIKIQMDGAGLILTVLDDGVGFDADQQSDGQGLVSMSRRAKSLGGHVVVTSGTGGTSINLSVPWDRSGGGLPNLGIVLRRLRSSTGYSGNGKPPNRG
ncbi:MAG TPA: two-component regulator propeller domain-containing protein [Blastocatellia bacterium]